MPFNAHDLKKRGLVFDSKAKLYTEAEMVNLANDTAMVTTVNNGIPIVLTNVIHPEQVRVLYAPMNSTLLFDDTQVGTRTTQTVTLLQIENKGEVSAYGDFATTGRSSANVNFPQRQQWPFQTVTVWGDMEVEMMAEAKLDWAGEQQISSALTIAKKLNYINFYGVSGLQNYGITNDPNLIATDTPVTVNGHSTWATKFAALDALAIFADFQKAVGLLMSQSAGLITQNDEIVVGVPPSQMTYLDTPLVYGGATVKSLVASNYPKLKIESIPEFESSGSGNLMYVAAKRIEGKPVGQCMFVEKMRAHGVIRELSSYKEKKSASSLGAIVFRPVGVVQILGI